MTLFKHVSAIYYNHLQGALIYKGYIEVQFTIEQATKAQRGRIGITLFFLLPRR